MQWLGLRRYRACVNGYFPGFGNDFETEALAGAAYEDREVPSIVTVKWCRQLHETKIGQSPLDVVALRGNHAPMKYDLRPYCPIGVMTMAGDVNTQAGMATQVYLVTESMTDSCYFSAGSEMFVVPSAVVSMEYQVIDDGK
jgi:homogentisate 1,2-dioxygenase